MDLANTYLFVEAQIVNTDGSDLDADTDVGSVNLWMHSLFSDVSVSLREILVSPPTSRYPYRAYTEPLLSYEPAANESQLTGMMWYKDTPEQQDKRTKDNKGRVDGPKQVSTNDGKTTFGFVLSRQILTQPRGSEN